MKKTKFEIQICLEPQSFTENHLHLEPHAVIWDFGLWIQEEEK